MNKSKYLPVLLIFLSAVGCSTGKMEEPLSDDLIQLSVVDTIGVEHGDERYVFGAIAGVQFDLQSKLLVLDGINGLIRVYSQGGEFLDSFGGLGSGPGEFLEPLAFTILSTGEIAVVDWDSWCIWLFTESNEYSGRLGPFPDGPPLSIRPGANGRIAGLGLSFGYSAEDLAGEYFIAAWSDSVIPVQKYLSGDISISALESGEITIDYPAVCFDTDPLGNLYYALSTDSTWRVEYFSATGVPGLVLEQEYSRRELSSAALVEVMQMDAETGAESENETRFSLAITGVYCDGTDRVWVRSGGSDHPYFDVYSSEGEHLESVSCPGLCDPLSEIEFLITEFMIIAWDTNPVDYPKVYLLNNPFS